jgi:hypothetical protein
MEENQINDVADSPESAAAGTVQFVETNRLDLTTLLFAGGPPAVVLSLAILVFGGVKPVLEINGEVFAFIALVLIISRWTEFCRAEWDDRRVILKKRNGRSRPFELAWCEIKRVSRFGGKSSALTLQLDRPRRWWALRANHSVVIPSGLVWQPAFLEALKKHVPIERFHKNVFPSDKVIRRRRLLSSRMFLLAAAAIVVSMVWSVLNQYKFLPPMAVTAAVTVMATMSLSALVVNDRLKALVIGSGYSICGGFVGLFLLTIVTGNAHRPFVLMGVLAGLLAGIALAVLFRSLSTFSKGMVVCVTTIAGLFAANVAYNGIAPLRVAEGVLPTCDSPWTSSGDGFLAYEWPFDYSLNRPKTLRWYSAEGKPGHTVRTPSEPSRLKIGQDGAVGYIRTKDGRAEYVLLPRRSGDMTVLNSGDENGGSILSTDGQEVLYRYKEMPERTWRLCDIATGRLREVQLPTDASRIVEPKWRDDGSLIWLELMPPPEDAPYRMRVSDASTCTLWTWRLGEENAELLYTSSVQGRNWTLRRAGSELVFQRHDPASGLWEWANVHPFEQPERIVPDESPQQSSRESRGSEGRYQIVVESLLGPPLLKDRQTGKSRPILFNTFFGNLHAFYSSDSERFVVQEVDVGLFDPLFAWERPSTDYFEAKKSTIYLLKVDED